MAKECESEEKVCKVNNLEHLHLIHSTVSHLARPFPKPIVVSEAFLHRGIVDNRAFSSCICIVRI